MILDVDWETGLKAWRQLFNFPHPVASCPDVIPSPEDLVDVVVMTRLPQPKEKSEKKKKNQGKGKGKKKDKDQKQFDSKENQHDSGTKISEQNDVLDAKNPEVVSGIQDQQNLEEKTNTDIAETTEKLTKFDANSGAGDGSDLNVVKSGRNDREIQVKGTGFKLEKEDNKGRSGDCVENKFDGASSKKESDDGCNGNKSLVKSDAVPESILSLEEAGLKSSEESDSLGLKTTELNKDGRGSNSASNECTVINSADGEYNRIKSDSEKGDERKTQQLAPPKTVIVKKITSAEMLPKIDIKVLNPVDTENVFPTALESEELRHLEPMEVDSPNASFNLKSSSVSSEKGEEEKENIKDSAESDKPAGNVDNNVSDLNPSTAAAAFATSVINRLSSPPTSPARENQASAKCTTPPPTPIASIENPFLAANSSPIEQSRDIPAPISDKLTQAISDCGSSVDPLSYNKDTLQTDPALQHVVLSEPEISKSNVAESSALKVHKETESLDSEHCKEIKSQSNLDEDKELLKKSPKAEPDPTKPKFRVTCNRVGEHPFDSSSAAASFGSAIITYFKWPVDLKNFDIEVKSLSFLF